MDMNVLQNKLFEIKQRTNIIFEEKLLNKTKNYQFLIKYGWDYSQVCYENKKENKMILKF